MQSSSGSLRTLKAASPVQCLSLISNLVNSAVWMTRWAPARKQTSMKNKSTQATFGNPDHSYRFLLAKEMGFEIYHGICLPVWYYLSICYQQGCSHFSQGHVGGMMKPCLCPASLHQCDHCHTQPLCRAQCVGHRRTSGLTMAVKSLEVSIYCSLQVRRPSTAKGLS